MYVLCPAWTLARKCDLNHIPCKATGPRGDPPAPGPPLLKLPDSSPVAYTSA